MHCSPRTTAILTVEQAVVIPEITACISCELITLLLFFSTYSRTLKFSISNVFNLVHRDTTHYDVVGTYRHQRVVAYII